MNGSKDIPDLVEQFLTELGGNPQWITVREIRERFCLSREHARFIAAFLKRLAFRPCFEYPFAVYRIERVKGHYPSETTTLRYLVKRR